ncbi:undecaprenyl-phosphate glucose phosphotransferase, partial [Escherichia coli]
MTNLKKRERARTNASLISMVQRFSDITIMVGGLWAVCWISGQSFLYMHLLMTLIALVGIQMIGGVKDFSSAMLRIKNTDVLMVVLQDTTEPLNYSHGL